jgi:dihydroorotase
MIPAHDLTITNASLWNADAVSYGMDIHIHKGQVESIHSAGSRSAKGDVIEASGLTVLPAGVDAQVHLRVPGQEFSETPMTGLRAARAGGIAAILTMPNTNPVIDCPEIVQLTRQLVASAEEHIGVKVLISAALSLGQKGEQSVDFASLVKAGVTAFTDDGRGLVRDDLMEEAFAASAAMGFPVLQHAEFPGHGCALAAGPLQEAEGLPAYPSSAEVDMVARDLRLLRKYPQARYHVLHISSAQTVELLAHAKKEGLNATGEVSPHHLFFTSLDISPGNTSYKMNPPLRSPEDRIALRAALSSGVIDFTATDHAPHAQHLKNKPWAEAAFGTTGLETMLRTLLHLWHEKELTTQRLVEVFSRSPARFLGLDASYGKIAEGLVFRGVIINTEVTPDRILDEHLESLSGNNVFKGCALPGKLVTYINNGMVTNL